MYLRSRKLRETSVVYARVVRGERRERQLLILHIQEGEEARYRVHMAGNGTYI